MFTILFEGYTSESVVGLSSQTMAGISKHKKIPRKSGDLAIAFLQFYIPNSY